MWEWVPWHPVSLSGPAGAGVRHFVVQPWCTHHPPNEQLLIGMAVGAVVHRSSQLWRRGPCGVLEPFLTVVGPWCSFLIVIGAIVIHSPYPTCKQVLAAVGMDDGLVLSCWGV